MSNVKLGIGAKIWNTSTEEDVGNIIHDNFSEYTEKVTTHNDDEILINDSEASGVIKRTKKSAIIPDVSVYALLKPASVEKTTDYTLTAGDEGKVILANHATNTISITIPLDTTHEFALNTEIAIIRMGAGEVKIIGASNVDVYSADSDNAIANQYQSVAIKKLRDVEWVLIGALKASA